MQSQIDILDEDFRALAGTPGADEAGLFADGFESGDTSGWSSAVP